MLAITNLKNKIQYAKNNNYQNVKLDNYYIPLNELKDDTKLTKKYSVKLTGNTINYKKFSKLTDKNLHTSSIKIADLEVSLGNSKLPITTMIYNMSTAINCSSNKLGLCEFGTNGKGKLKNKCYALQAEKMYTTCRDFRLRQESYWNDTNIKTIISHISLALRTGKGKNVNAIRFNESGDFKTKKCITKLIKIAKAFPQIKIYTYTHRSDLLKSIKIEDLPSNLNINLSYINNKKGFNTFILDTQYTTEKTIECKKCFKGCTLCQKGNDLNISVKIH